MITVPPLPSSRTWYVSSASAAATVKMALCGFAPGTVIDVATTLTSLPSPKVPSPPLPSSRKVFRSTDVASTSRSKPATICVGPPVWRSTPGIGVSVVTRIGKLGTIVSSTAPSVIHCRMTSISACAIGPLGGICPPLAPGPSSLLIR